jgi:hypothetical protein
LLSGLAGALAAAGAPLPEAAALFRAPAGSQAQAAQRFDWFD